jgi:hypothetical protein
MNTIDPVDLMAPDFLGCDTTDQVDDIRTSLEKRQTSRHCGE